MSKLFGETFYRPLARIPSPNRLFLSPAYRPPVARAPEQVVGRWAMAILPCFRAPVWGAF